MFIPVAFMRPTSYNLISGVDGVLNIANGVIVDVAEGSVKEYSSINIDAGGTLRITGNTGAWTEIGCAGNCVINGEILCRSGYPGQTTHSGGTFTKTSSFGLGSLSYSISQSNGSTGGAGQRRGSATGLISAAGAQSAGCGGGGGGGTGGSGNGGAGAAGSNVTLGDGNSGTSATTTVTGSGGSGGGGNGGAGGANSTNRGGGGGGGGYKGHHGKGLVLYVEGALSGSGTVNCSGRQGFNGGNGGNSSGTATAGPGSGGGGGGGGGGGQIILRYRSGTAPTLSVGGGSAGANGSAGSPSGGAGTLPGNPVAATAGGSGSTNVATI